MAEYLPKGLAEELTCHICTEIYTDPVQLSCQHTFCRECLKVYVRSGETQDISKDNTAPDGQVEKSVDNDTNSFEAAKQLIICCPVCRNVIELDANGVSKLPVHFTIANIVEKFKNDSNALVTGSEECIKAETAPKCSLCDGDQPKAAVKCCMDCKCLYCEECFRVCHPMRGPLSKHILMDAKQYSVTSVCEEHNEPLQAFCSDCKHLYCYPCSVQYHGTHILKTAEAGFIEEKERITTKTDQLNKLYDEINSCILELTKTEGEVEQCFRKESLVIENQYQTVLADLDKWRSESLDVIETKRKSLVTQIKSETERLRVHEIEIENYLAETRCYFESSDAIQYLMVSDETVINLTKRNEEMDSVMKSNKSWEKEVRKARNEQPLVKEIFFIRKLENGSLEHRIGGHTILCPAFSLKKEVCDCVSVVQRGQIVVILKKCFEDLFHGALADQSYQSGQLYWEMIVTYEVKIDEEHNTLVWSAGVVQESCKLDQHIGMDEHSWSVDIDTYEQRLSCWHSGDMASESPIFPDGKTKNGTVGMGFYLDCINQTFTILDCTHDRILHTFSGVDLSKPLTPVVVIYNYQIADVSVRLRTGQSISTIPQCLYNKLLKTSE